MDQGKFDSMFQILSKYNFKTNDNELICKKCKNLLNNCCRVACGCSYCRNCIEEMLLKGCQSCPVVEEFCGLEKLSSFITDYKTNQKISKLIVKCPNEECSYECELISMTEHLKLCTKQCMNCPFIKAGCISTTMTGTKMSEHLQSESYYHSKIIMEIIDCIKTELVENENRYKIQINALEEKLTKKNEKIQLLNNEIILIKTKNDNLEQKMEICIRNLWNKIDEMTTNINNNKIDFEDQLDIANKQLLIKVDELKLDINDKISEKLEMENTNSILIENSLNKMTEWKLKMNQDVTIGIEKRLDITEKWLQYNIDGIFVWAIDKVVERRRNAATFSKNLIISSSYFYNKMEPYKMQIEMYPNGTGEMTNVGLSIYLNLWYDVLDDYFKWPFCADITISIINQHCLDRSKIITKKCRINQPKFNKSNSSEYFNFLYSELNDFELLRNDCFIVTCSIDLK